MIEVDEIVDHDDGSATITVTNVNFFLNFSFLLCI